MVLLLNAKYDTVVSLYVNQLQVGSYWGKSGIHEAHTSLKCNKVFICSHFFTLPPWAPLFLPLLCIPSALLYLRIHFSLYCMIRERKVYAPGILCMEPSQSSFSISHSPHLRQPAPCINGPRIGHCVWVRQPVHLGQCTHQRYALKGVKEVQQLPCTVVSCPKWSFLRHHDECTSCSRSRQKWGYCQDSRWVRSTA